MVLKILPNDINKGGITHLFLKNNKLSELDIEQLVDLFPNLECLAADHNNITKVIFPKYFPTHLTISLTNNIIENILILYRTDDCKLDLRNKSPIKECPCDNQ